MLVRAAQAADIAAIAGIHVRSWRATYAGVVSVQTLSRVDEAARVALWSRRLTTPETCHLLVACLPAVVGFVYLGPSPDPDDDPAQVGQVLSVHVDPPVTGQGVGGALLDRAVVSFRTGGYRAATLWVVGDNTGARRFYERAGWSPEAVSRREPLAVEGESGEDVTVVRYRISL